jgi:hypothetical protein
MGGQGSINMPQAGKSPIEGILAALQAVHAYYGIDTEKAQKKLLDHEASKQEFKNKKEQEEYAKANDPNSEYTKAKRTEFSAFIPQLVSAGGLDKNSANDLLTTSQNMSGADIDKLSESSPLKLAIAKVGANAHQNTFSFRDEMQRERLDKQAHQKTVAAIKGNKELNAAATKAQNLNNALNNVEQTGIITAQDMADLQNLAIMNMGVSGGWWSPGKSRADG